MITATNTLKVVIALSNDVVDAKANLEKTFLDFNQEVSKKNFTIQFEIISPAQKNRENNELTEWSHYFYYETPIPLIERINEVYKPDLIICVFWKIFGLNQYFPTDTPEQAKKKSEEAVQEWTKKDFPETKILFCKQDPKLNEEEKDKRLFISYFRSQINKDVWALCNKNQIAKEIEKVLSDFVKLNSNENIEAVEQEQKYEPSPLSELNLPEDWLYLNKWLNENSALIGRKLDDIAAANFFNGMRPSFIEALSSSIPRRAIVKELLEKITKAATDGRFAVMLLLGPGGEGKSTILRQVAFDLIRQRKAKIQVIFRQGASNVSKLIENLRFKKGSFVIVSDDAQEIAKGISNLAKRDDRPNNIQFLLASKTTHWEWERRADLDLKTHLGDNFVKRRIGILIEKDAEEIVKAWEKANALEKLADFPSENRVNRFLSAATAKASQQNSLFSAILWVRKHQTLDARVKDILDGLKEKSSLNGETLDYYYNYIIALHGDGIPILTNLVLQEALSCDKTKLNEEVLDPLVGETAILQEGALVLARHDVFAERAKEILKSRVDFNKIIGKLAVAAEKLYKKGKLGSIENDKWLALKNEYYIKRKQPEVALAIVEAIATDEELVRNSVLVGRWANLLITWGEDLKNEGKVHEANIKFHEANNIFLEYYDKTILYRSYLTDWGVLQGQIGNNFLSAWLAAISLTDELTEEKHLVKPIVMRLANLVYAFGKSWERTITDEKLSTVFRKATQGAARLGLDERARKTLDANNFNLYQREFDFEITKGHLNKGLRRVKSEDISKISIEDAFQFILDGINLAWKLCEVDREILPKSLPNAPDLNFNKLKKVFGIKAIERKEYVELKEDSSNFVVKSDKTNKQYIFRQLENNLWEIALGEKAQQYGNFTVFQYIHRLLSQPGKFLSLQQLYNDIVKGNSTDPQTWRNSCGNTLSRMNNLSDIPLRVKDFLNDNVIKYISYTTEDGIPYVIYRPNEDIDWKLS